MKEKFAFVAKVTAAHVLTYVICGMLAMTLFDYQGSVDVYKRQALRRPDRVRIRQGDGGDASLHRCDGMSLMDHEGLDALLPVSYTHRDVYKRQGRG